MRNFMALTGREMRSIFLSPLAFGAAVMFLFVFGLVFTANFNRTHLVQIETLVQPIGYILPMLIAPLLTMRLLAEEKRQGTLEMLLTAPVGDIEVILSKFAGTLIFYGALLALTCVHFFAMFLFYKGPVDWGGFFAGYLGMLLIAGQFIAFGLFVSGLFENSVMAALVSFVAGLLVMLSDLMTSSNLLFKQGGTARDVFQFMLPYKHFLNLVHGFCDTGDLAYFVLTTGYFLFLGVKSLESRKWL